MTYIFLSIGLLFLGGILSTICIEKYKTQLCSLFAGISGILALIPSITVLYTGKQLTSSINFSNIFGAVDFSIDVISAIFIVIISIMGFLGVVYSNGYLKPYLSKNMQTSSHSFFMMILLASMLGVVITNNALFFLIIWEIMSLSSFFLVIFEGEKKEVRKAGIKYLVYMHFSVLFIIAMFAILSNTAHSLSFNDYYNLLATKPEIADIVFILGFIGFGIKAGFVPFHNWLPEAHPAAPSHISGIMSGVMIKTGIYGILRIIQLIQQPSKSICFLMLSIAVLTLLYGVLYAITQHDLKRLLAYSSIENIGIIGLGISIGMLGLAYSNPTMAILGFSGGILHIINHSIFKELLFFAAGNTYLKSHTKNIESLGGLIKKMPYTGTLFIIGCIAITGVPPFNGFVSEFLIYAGMLLGIPASEINLFLILIISIAALALAGTMAIVCFSKASGIVFLGEPRSDHAKNISNDVGKIMLIPMSILAILTFIIGMFPQLIIKPILTVVSMFVKVNTIQELLGSVFVVTKILSFIFCIFLIIFIIIFLTRILINKKHEKHETWGCGYDKPNSHMQYTPSSYDNLFVATLKPLFKRISHIKKPKELFPKEAYFELEIEDIEEAYIVEPIIKLDEKILSKFERIQNGNMQQYILFGLLFLVLSILGMIFGG